MKRFLLMLLISARVTAQTRALGISPLDGSGSSGSGVSGGTAGRFALFSGATTLTTDASATFSGSGSTFKATFNRVAMGTDSAFFSATAQFSANSIYTTPPTNGASGGSLGLRLTGDVADDWSAKSFFGLSVYVIPAGTLTSTTLQGLSGAVTATNTGTTTSATGTVGSVSNAAAGSTLSNAIALKGTISNASGGTIGNAYGVAVSWGGATAVQNRYGLSIDNQSTATTLAYGVFIADQTASGAANAYNIYSDGTTARNWFEGPIHMGASTALVFSSATPTISSGFGSSPSVTAGMATAFRLNVGTGGAATTGVVALPTATTGWNCTAADVTNPDTSNTVQTASTTATASFKNYSRTTGAATAWAASDILAISCTAF